ncbi:helix-turn-helix domain-containing protein [Sulfuricurvum sp.]|uniref:helix-turn-helix domain-containing protein n=1 Tax=Sulfuricurvum sp. TaxID=2025608 RepID=UPI003BB209A1
MELLDKYITDKQVIEKFGIAKGTLANYRSQGKLSYSKFGGSVIYKVSDIEEFLERNRIEKSA